MSQKPVIILGGGLWGGLLAYRWHQLHPEVDILLVDEATSFGGNHTWCFHESDISSTAREWLRPFVAHTWTGYQVKFPTYERTLNSTYHALSSTLFHDVLISTIPQERRSLAQRFNLEEAFERAAWVVDARGEFQTTDVAYQKFLGLELELEHDHGLEQPMLMDATVAQVDGFRFLYFLPFGPRRILVEDTRYSNSPKLHGEDFRQEILQCAKERNWKIKAIRREEQGILPLPLSTVTHPESEAIQLGGLFHDTTGYSLPDAIRVIERLLEKSPTREHFSQVIQSYRKERQSDRKFFRLLNRFMFRASPDQERYRMLEFFYRHSPQLISGFYSGRLSSFEKFRFFLGRPPVSIFRALREVTT